MSCEFVKPILYALNVSAFKDEELFEKAYNQLSFERREKIDRFIFEKDKLLSLGAGILLKYALKKAGASDIKTVEGKYGKPYLENENIFFNLSHSGEMVICAVSSDEIGCDIEKKENPDIKIAQNFFTNEEYCDIINSDDVQDRFYRYWTLKESFVKAVGYGMQVPFEKFSIDLKDGVSVNQNINTDNYYFWEINDFDNYCCAVCLVGKSSDILLETVTPNEILGDD